MARFNPEIHRRRSTRQPGHDYSKAGAYFVTFCTDERVCWFGDVVGDHVSLSRAGRIVEEMLLSLPRRFPGTKLDAFVVMPNHIHAIVRFSGSNAGRPRSSLGEVLRTVKAASTTLIRASGETGFSWQRNYHDRVIRDDAELRRVRAYIATNPRNWPEDPENPLVAKNLDRGPAT